MSRLYLEIGSCPADEEAAQTTDPLFREKNQRECELFIHAIRNKLGAEPLGAALKIKAFEHEFGTYRECVCYYDTDRPESEAYAFRVESEAPTTWAEGKVVAPGRGRVRR